MKPLSMPVPVEVREGPDHRPVMVRLGKRWHGVARVEDLWSFDLWWMAEPISRTYYRVSLDVERQATLFRDGRGAAGSGRGTEPVPSMSAGTLSFMQRASTPSGWEPPTRTSCWPGQWSTAIPPWP